MPVTGFRETAWVAGSHKLWKSGVDVFLSKDGETFKELKAADYIPVGATLNVDGIKCRIDAVDFAADEVRLTNIEDKNRPIRFSESIQYVRAYVEDAGTAIYDTIPKKPAARESIRDKLKSAQKAQPSHTPKPQKTKERIWNSDMKNFTVEEINLMCCFNTSSRKRLIDDMKGVTLNDMDGEIAELMYKTVRKLEAMTDAEFEELYIMPDGMVDD